LDVRPADLFLAGHRERAGSVPLEELASRVHELPGRARRLLVIDPDPARAEEAAALLRARGFDAAPASAAEEETAGPIRAGPARVRLWEPNAFLAAALPEIAAAVRLPGARAVDLAAGSGRDAVYLAAAGFAVTAVDILPDALERARDLAAREGVAIETRVGDLAREPIIDEIGASDLVVVVSYLERSLFPAIRRAVRPGGFLVYETFLLKQRELFGRPRNPAHLLEPGELRNLFSGWEIRAYREGLAGPRRHVASLFARRPEVEP
jgi:SAM-dependent methyltransferase